MIKLIFFLPRNTTLGAFVREWYVIFFQALTALMHPRYFSRTFIYHLIAPQNSVLELGS